MMANVAEDEPPTPPHGMPPQGMDADEYRRFQEFQRFQDYQRFVEAQRQGANLPVPVQPNQPVPHHPEQALETRLDSMRQQLARIEKVTNPPTWQKILRNKWLHRGIWLIVIIVLVTWGVPKLINHYFGGNNNPGGPAALHPGQVSGSGKLYNNPADAVAEFYHVVMAAPPGNATACEAPTNAGGQQLAHDLGVANCVAAVNKIYGELTPPARTAYEYVQVPDSAIVRNGDTAQVSSCAMTIDAGPRLGLFLLTRNPTGDWQITGHQNEPNPCPPPPTTTTPPPPTS